jgi:uncharacterized membrane protein
MEPLLPATTPAPAPELGPPPERAPEDGWAVPAGRGYEWWKCGWQLFTDAPWIWLAITLLFLAIMFGLSLVPFIGQIASTLLYPVLGAGVLLGTAALDRGGKLTVGHLFACFNDKAMPLIIVAVLYFGGWFIVWLAVVAMLIGVVGFGTLSALFSSDPGDATLALIAALGVGPMIVVLIGVLLGVPLVMAYWFAPALVVFRGSEPFAAMKASFSACLRNMPPFLVYGLIGIVVGIVATIPLGLGWFVLMPVYAATLYASYKDIFGAPQQ